MGLVEVLTVIGTVVGILATFFGLRRIEPALRPRSRLKADLEILRMLEPKDPEYDIVRRHIDTTITKLYELRGQQGGIKGLRVYNWSAFALGIICFPGFTFWTWYLVNDGFSWWAIATGWFAFAALGWVYIGFEEKRVPLSSDAGTAKDTRDQSGGGQ